MNEFLRLLKYVRPHWLTFLFAFAAMILVAAFETATGALLVPIFDQFLPNAAKESKTLFDLNSLIPRDNWFLELPLGLLGLRLEAMFCLLKL